MHARNIALTSFYETHSIEEPRAGMDYCTCNPACISQAGSLSFCSIVILITEVQHLTPCTFALDLAVGLPLHICYSSIATDSVKCTVDDLPELQIFQALNPRVVQTWC